MSEKIPDDVRRFVSGREVDAVVQRIGLDTWDLLLIDASGDWTRWVTVTKESAEAAARELGATVHDGWDADELAKRMNRHDDWTEPGGHRRAV
ncbi:MAG TPA: hypothetical protein VID47_01225 [Actinomycetota bacterium]